ncbi:MAG TPA: hypothetical protein VGR16_15615 [Thermomicrobiales bacterium]|nr:hypothetical protein [Thermomicrobiales bacterium]
MRYGRLLVYMAICLYPFIWMVVTSLPDQRSVFTAGSSLWVSNPKVPAPVRPSDDVDRVVGWRPAEPDEEPAEFGHGERNVPGADTSPLFVVPIANTASASSARVMCRYQPR